MRQVAHVVVPFVAAVVLTTVESFVPHKVNQKPFQLFQSALSEEVISTAPGKEGPSTPHLPKNNTEDRTYWQIGSTFSRPSPLPLTNELQQALETNTHPAESQSELGKGIFVTGDWRKAWHTYQSPPEFPDLIDPDTGYAEYEIDPEDIEGELPDDLVGVLYRNGPGKFGVNGERVVHALDADGLITQIIFPPTAEECSIDNDNFDATEYRRRVMFRSRFVETKAFVEEREAKKFLYRGTFGTGPTGAEAIFGPLPRKGLNENPTELSLLSKIAGNAFNTDIKNTANTQVISFGGKLLALFEAGLPHAIDPDTLETLGEDDMGGVLPKDRLPVKLGLPQLDDFAPDFIGGAAHTAHPNVCPRTGNLVGWHWSQLVMKKSLEATFTEWSPDNFEPIASKTFEIPGCELAPHDMALTDNCILLKVNALEMNTAPFLAGISGPAAALEMDGRAPVYVNVFPRPTSPNEFEPFRVEVPPCFSIHFSNAYEDDTTGNIVAFFSGWPPSDSKDFLGAWGGFAPDFAVIPVTYMWKIEIDPIAKQCVDLSIAPGSANVCADHPLVHPNFSTKKAQNVYVSASNTVGDSTPPNGFARLRVEDGESTKLKAGEPNQEVDAYWFGSRFFGGEPLIVPKKYGNPNNEEEAYLLGMVEDSARDRSFLAIFDLEQDLKEGPICKLWLKSLVPHGLHGCFATDGGGSSSVFC